MFDCCHAGGIHRDGGPRVRGITPPDDIRHRLLEWSSAEQMWRERPLRELNQSFGGTESQRKDYMGSNGSTYRIGRGMKGRVMSGSVYRRLPPEERGPYLPVIIEACQEKRLSYEYRDGATSYGAFTYSFVKGLRRNPTSSFVQAVTRARSTLANLGYRQEPQIIGPSSVVHRPLPGKVTPKRKQVRRRKRA
jgi:hypothetical protein